MGIEVEDRPFAKSTLQVFRAQLILHDRVREVFESSLRLARESGYLKRRSMRVALDTTNILGRGAVKDTCNLLADGIVKLLRALAVQVMAHNLARWAARIGLGEQLVTTKTLRRRFFSIAGRLTRSARRLTLHLTRRWPWEAQFSRALARLRAIPHPV